MELVKKHHQKIISFGFILLSFCSAAIFFITKPQKANVAELYTPTGGAELVDIDFPYSVKLPAPSTRVNDLTLYFGDDSINKYDYEITVSNDSDILYEHTYTDTVSNIVILPLDNTKDYLNKDLEINITCKDKDKCKNVKFKLLNTDTGQFPRVTSTFSSSDYRYLWFSALLLVIGLTLLPLSKETTK